jgi:flagellar biosynthesis protein
MKEKKEKTPVKKKAVALQYKEKTHRAPVVIAKGYGSIAEKIIEIAKKHNLHIHEDADMVEVLSRLDIGQEIPEYLYKAIAEILAFVYKLNKRYQ